MINPKSPFPLTIGNVDEGTLLELKRVLDEMHRSWNADGRRQLVALVARSNLRCEELDDYCAGYRPKLEAALDAAKKSSPEWAQASDLDREDLLVEFEEQALRTLDLVPCDRYDRDLVLTLLREDPENLTVDDALIDRYGFDRLSFYLRFADRLDKVHRVPADAWGRKEFEALIQAGLARRGGDIPLEHLLATLRLKDLNEMISDPGVKRFSRKAPAVEYFTRQPNLQDLLSSRMALRELFQLCPLPGEFSRIDLGAVARSWRHADAVARVIEATYRGGLASLDERQSVRGMGGDIIGWELHLDEDAPPFCKRVADKAAKSVRMPKVPAHIGCGCHIYPRFHD